MDENKQSGDYQEFGNNPQYEQFGNQAQPQPQPQSESQPPQPYTQDGAQAAGQQPNGGYNDPQYGQPQYGQPQYGQYQQPPVYNQQPQNMYKAELPGKGMGIAALVLGIASLVCCCIPGLSAVAALIGLILGIISIRKASSAGENNTMAVVGVVLSAIGLLLGIWMIINMVNSFSDPEFMDQFKKALEEGYNSGLEATRSQSLSLIKSLFLR